MELQEHADKILKASICSRTLKRYEKQIKEYLGFSVKHSNRRFRLESLRQYIAKLHLDGLADTTITSHMSALKFHCKRHSIVEDLDSAPVKAMLRGVRNRSRIQPPTLKEGCTIRQLQRIIHLAKVIYTTYEGTMLSSMFSLAFFGFLRVSEYSFTQAGHMIKVEGCRFKDIGLNVTIPSSKSNRNSVTIFIRKYSDSDVCPVRCLQRYLKLRPSSCSPGLFLLSDASPITAAGVSKYLKSITDSAGYKSITSHSFRIGGATWAAAQGWSDASIRAHGRWKSNAFVQYVRPY